MQNDATSIQVISTAFNEIYGRADIVPEQEGDATLEFLIKAAVTAVDAVCLYTHASANDNDRRERPSPVSRPCSRVPMFIVPRAPTGA
ncbi:hypothetical protein [Paracoccus hibiscisoli]|uniref:Uncharacterized protein n=1 Tax=Paracoccus hibiscisoli TaxID=2023261 RepID=A0A4U0QVB3_9RHOB|nr:hypothetical protein [Paracoccus hibiscisoli]TJZ86067.1 hypothetical protein FA740_04000 [Paracoccus hibiscisoli]